MKKILLILLLLPVLAFSQISSWRGGSSSGSQFSSPPPRIQSPIDGRSGWRDYSPREYNRPQSTRPGSNIIVRDPWFDWGWGWGRWGMWGAPAFGWNYWNPYWYYNDFGYRQPGRIYIYENGKRDTVFGKKPIINFGLHKTTNDQIGGYFAIGNKGYFIVDFVSTYKPDNSTYFPYGTLNKVDFPLIADLKKERTIYFGGGKRFGRLGIHASLGFGSERVYWRGKDKIGEITFPKYRHEFTTLKVGVLRDFKNFTLKADHDPIRDYSQLGLGINL